MTKTTATTLLSTALALLLSTSCGKDPSPGPESRVVTVTLDPTEAWVNTGIVLDKDAVLEISSDDSALGALYVRADDPLSTRRHGGLIGRLGTDSRPFWVGTGYAVVGNSINQGSTLYLGRNDTDFTATASGPLAFEPRAITATVTLAPNAQNQAALVSPQDGYYSTSGSPVFDWDDVDNALQYRIQLSQFPDFRTVEQDIYTVSSTQNPFAAPPGSNTQPLSPLPAGVHYWRVRAYVNVGRVTAPILEWGDWSRSWTYGVEVIGVPPTPTVTTPPQGASFALGDPILFEFTSPPQGSGLLWSYLFTSTTCGGTPSTTSFTSAVGSPLPWYVFPMTIDTQDPTQVPPLYAYFTATPDTPGQWLYRIETRAGSDLNASTVSFYDIYLTVGCP